MQNTQYIIIDSLRISVILVTESGATDRTLPNWAELSITSLADQFDEISSGFAPEISELNLIVQIGNALESLATSGDAVFIQRLLKQTILQLLELFDIKGSSILQFKNSLNSIELMFEAKLKIKWKGDSIDGDYPLNSHCGKLCADAITKASDFLSLLDEASDGEKHRELIGKLTQDYIRVVCYG